MRMERREQSRLCLCRLFEGEIKGKHDFLCGLLRHYGYQLKGKTRAANKGNLTINPVKETQVERKLLKQTGRKCFVSLQEEKMCRKFKERCLIMLSKTVI